MPSLKRAVAEMARPRTYGGQNGRSILEFALQSLFELRGAEYMKKRPEFIIPSVEEFFSYIHNLQTAIVKHKTHKKPVGGLEGFFQFLAPWAGGRSVHDNLIRCCNIVHVALILQEYPGAAAYMWFCTHCVSLLHKHREFLYAKFTDSQKLYASAFPTSDYDSLAAFFAAPLVFDLHVKLPIVCIFVVISHEETMIESCRKMLEVCAAKDPYRTAACLADIEKGLLLR